MALAHWSAALVALACTLGADHAQAATGNLLEGKAPTRSSGVSNAQVLTDGQCATEGDDWGTTASAVLESERSYVEYDLGRRLPFVAAYLQGDNNDEYVVSISDDGRSYRELWVAPSVNAPGLRQRASDGIVAEGRFIRLSARGGDHLYAVGELQLFSERPAIFPPRLVHVAGKGLAARVRTRLLYVVLAFGVLLFGSRSSSSRGDVFLLSLAPLVAAALAWQAVADAWPLGAREVAFARAAGAAVALLSLLRLRGGWTRLQAAHRWAVIGACAVSALWALSCFWNLGRPQFWDHGHGRPELVHTDDMRVYQPFAKYFEELRYDGVYLASVLAYAEDERDGSLESLAGTPIRNLRNQRRSDVSDLTDDIREVRGRFSDQRWAAFKRDMTFFREVMGPGYLATLTDHGANATPVWLFFARLILGHVPASETTLVAGALVDLLLLLAMAGAIGATFGLLPMLVAMTVFGATDLYMFGTNWAGATLRHDWLALLGFAACSLKRRRWVTAGVLLGLSTMIRAFPAAALVGVALPGVTWIVERWVRDRRPPPAAEILREHGSAARVLAAAAVTMISAFLVTGFLYSFGAWSEWWRKVALLNRDTAANEVSLRALIAGTDSRMEELMSTRLPIYVAVAVTCFAAVALVARRRPLHEAMLLALPLVMVIWNPVAYQLHFVFLLVLVETTTGLLVTGGQLLAMCVAGYWLTLDPDADRHFQLVTALLFSTLAWLYANVLRDRPASPEASGTVAV